ncbi:DNA polymerase III, delta subunit [Microscilla marina ATCC 23134]|uniref:DNA polymerase III subunit delta n=2 Tax=Microscilla marina TaxID=1027 RepID=A1ZQ74_MICM2|nr:DNA polymerase III, delta subunit [Microscilla marina ATCC 23134]
MPLTNDDKKKKNMPQTPENVLKDLKAKKYAPIYFLHGDESYYLDQISDFIEKNVLQEHEKGFNQIVLYGKDTNLGTIVQNARRFPMMAEKQVVIVKEAQQLADWSKADSKKIIEAYIKQPQPSTVLVFNHKHKSFNKNTTLYKLFDKQAVVVESKKIREHQVGGWIEGYFKQKGYQANFKATAMLTESIGADLGRLQTEIDKLLLNVNDQSKPIDEHLVEEHVGISKAYNIFELQKALGVKDWYKIRQILMYWEANPKSQPLIPTIAMIFQYFCKLLVGHRVTDKSDQNLAKVLKVSPYFVKDYKVAMRHYSLGKVVHIIHYLREADLQSKGVNTRNTSDAQILQELVFKILA